MARFSSSKANVWLVIALLTLFMVINFMDKVILSVVAVPLMTDLGLSLSGFCLIPSSFFLLFSLSAIGGSIVERVSSKKFLLICAGIWGVAQFSLAFFASVPLLYFRVIC